MSRLDPRLLLQGYATGIFPMADSRDAAELFWVEPRNRAIIPLERFHISRSFRRTLRSGRYSVTHDTDFAAVIRACADVVGLFLPSVERIRKELPGFTYVLVSSTHNHHGPDTFRSRSSARTERYTGSTRPRTSHRR